MNKVESHIKEELGKTIIDLAVKHIKHWAKKEINYIRYALDYPLIIPVSEKKLVIAGHVILLDLQHNNIVYKDSKLIHNFVSKKAAILFCVFEKLNNFQKANEILHLDKKVGTLYDDLSLFKTKLSESKIDNFKRELYLARYNDTKLKFYTYKRELEKSINNAKYMKIWDKIL